MTDYELITAFNEYNTLMQTSFTNYVAVLFAFLIAAYLIADKLESSMVPSIVALFTLVALNQLSNVIGGGHDWAAVGMQIAARATEQTSSLGWHGAATPWGRLTISILQFSAAVILTASHIGALIFFFHQRRLGRAQ